MYAIIHELNSRSWQYFHITNENVISWALIIMHFSITIVLQNFAFNYEALLLHWFIDFAFWDSWLHLSKKCFAMEREMEEQEMV